MLHTMETNFLTHFLSQKSPTPSNTPKVIRDKVGTVEGLEKSRFPDSDLTPHFILLQIFRPMDDLPWSQAGKAKPSVQNNGSQPAC